MSPEEIVEEAVKNDVGVLAVADHNTLEGSLIARSLCKDNGIHYVPAVEIDTITNGEHHHVLAYGFDTGDAAFLDFISHMRFMLDESSIKLVERMQNDCPAVSLEDFFKYTYDRRLGGWKALHYFMERGLTSELKEGMPFYQKYGVTFDMMGFSTISATAHRIKSAGGYSVLAHPGETIDSSDTNKFKEEVRRLILYGLDGIECYYHKHSIAVTKVCLDICNEYDLMITAGSDCHGTFIKTRVGEMNIKVSDLRLKRLLREEARKGYFALLFLLCL
jgi:hypothetical protein